MKKGKLAAKGLDLLKVDRKRSPVGYYKDVNSFRKKILEKLWIEAKGF